MAFGRYVSVALLDRRFSHQKLIAWNVGCVLYIVWTAIGCLLQFINSLAWSHDAINRAPAWCDFFVRVTSMASVGIPAASLVIARRLCKIANGTTVRSTRRDKQRAIMTDLAIGLTPSLATLVICMFTLCLKNRRGANRVHQTTSFRAIDLTFSRVLGAHRLSHSPSPLSSSFMAGLFSSDSSPLSILVSNLLFPGLSQSLTSS